MRNFILNSVVGFVASYCTVLGVGLVADTLNMILRNTSAGSWFLAYLSDPIYFLLCIPLSWLIGWIIRTRVLNSHTSLQKPNARSESPHN